MRKIVRSKYLNDIIQRIMLFFIIFLVCAASFHGFFSICSLRDDNPRFGIEVMLNGTADQPFVYRQLLPLTAKEISSFVPQKTKDNFQYNYLATIYSRTDIKATFNLEYYIVFFLAFIFFLLSIYTLRETLSDVLNNTMAGTLGALLFAILIPFFENKNGYYYDFSELFFLFLTIKFAMRGQWISMIFLAPLAACNKESILLFLPTLYPLLRQKISKLCTFIVITTAMVLAGIAHLIIKMQYINNEGGTVEIHLMEQIDSFLDIRSYFTFSYTYGLPMGSELFFLHILLIGWLIWHCWDLLPKVWQTHAKIALVITFPLYLLFCSPGELRNLSFMYMSFALILGTYIKILLNKNLQN